MRTYTVYTTRHNQWADKAWRGKIKEFVVADWTEEESKEIQYGDLAEFRPPLAILFVKGIHDEETQRMLSHKLCDAVNKMLVDRRAIEVSL